MRHHNHTHKIAPKTLLEFFGSREKLDSVVIELGKGKERHGLILREGKVMEFYAHDKFARRITIIREYQS